MRDLTKRISSSPLTSYVDCPRKAWFEYTPQGGKPVKTNRAMAAGTVFHAFMEFFLHKGRWPARSEFAAMEGNYSDPIEAVRQFPDVYDDAFLSAEYVLQETDILQRAKAEGAEIEVDIEEWDYRPVPGGPVYGGYVDLLTESEQKISDWKFRGGFGYVPRTYADFKANPQLCYYAAVCAYHFGWESVTVEHLNVLRPDRGGPKVLPIAVELPSSYLRGIWQHLKDTIVPDMVHIAGVEDMTLVPRSQSACFKYGKCSHYGYCEPHVDESTPEIDALALLGD